MLIEIKNLHADSVSGTEPPISILRGLSLAIKPGEVHALMGPNGSGKSTLSHVLAGREGLQVTAGSVSFQGQDLLALTPEARAAAGLFLAFQYPVDIPGVNNAHFLRTAANSIRKQRGNLPPLDAIDFLALIKNRMQQAGMAESFLQRAVNEGFSGGEKKRNEILQMLLLEPRLALLDETDSGLDIDALQAVAEGVNSLRSPERGFLLITHYHRLLDHIVPDVVHVMMKGRIIKTGDASLAMEVEKRGYGWLEAAAS